ncbi:hypothetical protein SNE40_005357 [Patella caerulea]|uniref:BTB domain-containing protein n=1 Tax=Patella caerulea TaxID=87958 RepID=A0AAN8K3G5_PATCE
MAKRLKRYSAPPMLRQYPDPSKPPLGDDEQASLSDGCSKKVKTSQSFESLFDNESLSDVILNLNDGHSIFHAHKMILSMKSDVLASMLNKLVTEPGTKPTLNFQESLDCTSVFSRFLYFIYSGAVWLHRDYVIPLYKLANKYSVRPLASHCESYIQQLLITTSFNVSDVQMAKGFSIEAISELCDNPVHPEEVKKIAFRVLCTRFRELTKSACWTSCCWETVRDLIRDNECEDENLVLMAATDWMKKNKISDKKQIEAILSNIRYPLLNRRVLYQLQKNYAFKKFPQVQDQLLEAMKFHCFKELPEAKDDFHGIQYMTRHRFVTHVTSVPPTSTTVTMTNYKNEGQTKINEQFPLS